MVIFKKLEYKNFLSTGNNSTTIDLDVCPLTLIIGSNGGGKSTVLDALSFVLFGKPHRAINKPQLINSINNKNCLVKINFSIGSTDYKIVRGIKPNVFEIYQNKVLLNQESNSRDYQKLLETNILKLNHKSFHQVVVLGSSNFIPFMQLTSYQRRGVIEDLLDIGVFTKMNMLLKESSAKQKDLIKDTEHSLNLVQEKIKLQMRHLSELQSINDRNSKNIELEISSINEDLSKIRSTTDDLIKIHNSEFPDCKKRLDEKQKILNQLLSFEINIKQNIETIVKDAKFYEMNSTCPTCEQIITDTTKDAKLHECKNKASSLSKGYEELKTEIESSRKEINKLMNSINELNSLMMTISSNNNSILSMNKRISDMSKQLKENPDLTALDQTRMEVEQLNDSKRNLSNLKMMQIEDKLYSDVISELLKDTGIKTKIIKQYLPIMNNLINQYLQILDFFVSFHLDESFNETIKSRHRDDFSYASFSEGEKARIDLALLFAWRQIARMKNSANTNLLILDEVFDSSVDGDGIDCFMQILSSLDSSTRTFIISHKQDIQNSAFDRTLKFSKIKNFSSCKEQI